MKKIVFATALTSLLFSSCTTLQPFSFERLKAADVNFPEQVKNIGIVNQMPVIDWDNQSVDYASGLLEGDGKVATEALAQGIAETGYFAQVIICDSAIRAQGGTMAEDQFIPQETVDSLMEALSVDMLLAMERVRIQLEESSIFLPDVMMEVPAMDGIVTSLVRAYASGRSTPLYTVNKTDTICWELTPELTYNQIIQDASGHAASLAVVHIIPHWEEAHRYYFDGGNADMRDAGVYVREQNWTDAADLWQKLYDSRTGKVRMRAAYNLALYYEMRNDLDESKAYLETAASLAKDDSWEAQLIAIYQLQLEEQIKQRQRLKLQMKRFEP